MHQHLGQDWEATAYHALMAAFGFQKNSEPLARLAKALPLAVLRRHRHDQRQLEALLFGQAGFLVENEETAGDAYIQDLRQEHEFLRHKYGLGAAALPVHEWNYLRLRPANFPPVRLGQLAGLLHARPALVRCAADGAKRGRAHRIFPGPGAGLLAHALPGPVGRARCRRWARPVPICSSPTWWCRCAWPTPATWASLRWWKAAWRLLGELPAEHNQYTDVYDALGFAHRTRGRFARPAGLAPELLRPAPLPALRHRQPPGAAAPRSLGEDGRWPSCSTRPLLGRATAVAMAAVAAGAGAGPRRGCWRLGLGLPAGWALCSEAYTWRMMPVSLSIVVAILTAQLWADRSRAGALLRGQ
ncbi:MAG: DUF2851 family protein [Hymenobacter sp.]